MTGKLELGLGDDHYGFFPRIAKQFAEIYGSPTKPTTADGSTVSDPVPDGSTLTLDWDANFQPVSAFITIAGETQRDAVLAALAAEAELTPSVHSATVQDTSIVLTPAPSFGVANAIITESP